MRRFAECYQRICSDRARDLEELVAGKALEMALALSDAEKRAVQQTLAGLADASGVQASVILRNLSPFRQIQVDKAGAIRGRPKVIVDPRGYHEIARALERLGVVEVIDADAEEIAGELEEAA
jgi:hypothetical protein